MKLLTGTAILCMLAMTPVYAQQNHDDKQQEPSTTPAKQAERPANKSPEKPIDRPSKPPKEAPVTTRSAPRQQDQQQKQTEQQAKAEQETQQNEQKAQQKQAKDQEKQQQKAEHQAENQTRDRNQNSNRGRAETADNGARGDQGGRRIPEDRYRTDFGRAHTFHVRHDHDRDHRFQFSGYWFEYTDAWPSDWDDDDDFYIVDIDDVDYLCDARYPDQRIEIIIAS